MIQRLYVDRALTSRPEVGAIAGRLGLEAVVLDDPRRVYAEINAAADPVERGKHTLLLTANRGAWLRQCPGTRHYTCCDYQILHIGTCCTRTRIPTGSKPAVTPFTAAQTTFRL